MRPRHLVLLFRLALLTALAASAVLVVDYRNAGDPAFCGVASGCFAVRVSGYSAIFGVPLPSVGLGAFASLLALSLVARAPAHHGALAALAVLGGAGATALLALQAFAINAFCPWCTAVDLAAIVAAGAAVLIAWQAGALRREAWVRGGPAGEEPLPSAPHGEPPHRRSPAPRVDPDAFARDAHGTAAVTAAWAAAAIAAIGLPFLWARYPVVPPLPAEIAALQAPGKVTLVGFTDFQCPFCRLLHPEIHKLQEEYGDRLHYVRKMMPLSGHPGALPAAKAYLCAPEAQRPDAATLLYAAPPDELNDEDVAAVLAPLHLDPAPFKACFASPETQAAIDADMALYKRLSGRGLPFTFVGRRVVLGNNPERIAEALRLEAAGDQPALPLAGLFAALGAAAALAAAVTLASKGKPPAPAET
jgi:uncharacterized membrane protein/GNAT superfamily N-acetyltransferase